jgi:Arc/MetJ-type ribon-helix-helix transcriptional regulator
MNQHDKIKALIELYSLRSEVLKKGLQEILWKEDKEVSREIKAQIKADTVKALEEELENTVVKIEQLTSAQA